MTDNDGATTNLQTLSPRGIIDCFVSGNPPDVDQGHWKRIERSFGRTQAPAMTAAEMIEEMDRNGIAKVLLAPPPETVTDPAQGYRWALETVQKFPERFGLSVRVDPREGMRAVRSVESMVRNDGVLLVRFAPYRVGLPPSDRMYFPIYTKCVELGIPVATLIGFMGPPVPADMQDPNHLDVVCGLWPELTVVACHGGEAWSGILERLLTKYANLYYIMSAHAPNRYPPTIVEYMNTRRGRTKVMFASDFPAIRFDRMTRSLPEVPLAPETWAPFLYDNAQRIFWRDGAAPAHGGASA